ncbi:hypothetical protein KVV02_005780 [Mortierella alpina]|uniref:AAA+ ATPase domain-containing protein n=1 Tax=Mortierella alpina TaxID=64518 RepID=A0A9P8AAY3_MORAP|nr:hypothetical protein KVV02_005780 [Mortierella alpina]
MLFGLISSLQIQEPRIMKLNVIASVDETSRQCLSSIAVSGERESTPTARSIVYVSREQCIQYRLRNSVVALTLPSKAEQEAPLPLYALVKMYSKESILFRKDTRFPGNLGVREPEAGSPKTWDVVVSNLLWWELSRQHQECGQFGTRKSLETFQEGRSMTSGASPIEIDAKLVSNIGSAIQITLDPPTGEGGAQWTPTGAAIAQSLSGSVVSLHGWISYKSPHDSQTFQVLQITSSNSEHPHVALMSDATVVRYATPSVTDRQSSSSRLSDSAAVNKSLAPVSEWIAAVKRVIGGYDDILEQITNHMYGYMETAIDNEGSTSTTSCFQAPFKGILISGRPGTGKSVMASSLAEHSGLPYTIINCPDVFQTGVEAKLFATLLHLVDSINLSAAGSKIFIIALTNRLHAVDSSLTRSGRLDKVFDLHLKGVEQRLQVLKIVSKDLPIDPKEKSAILRKVARATHGYVPTDLQALCTESAVALISQMASGQDSCANIDFSYFEHALKTIRPSGMGEFQSKIPTVKFSDLYGIQDAIADLRVSIIEPFHHPEKYLDLGIAPPRGVIIHGPPGVGKTMLCCALAEELGINFMLVESSQIRSKVVGESEQNIARMFAQAKANAPCILFIDQIDILAPSRGSTHTSENSGDRIVTGLLTEMDGFFSGGSGKGAEVDVLVLAATNRPEVIDAAILRPGRLDQIVHIPVPDQKARQEILEGYMSKMPMRISPEEIADMARTTDGYSGADLENLCREAALICLRQDINNTEIVRSHLEAARLVSKPSLLGYEDSHMFSR